MERPGREVGVTSTPDGHGSVAAVVVTYNRKDYLSQLLPSLLASTRPLDAIYVVDNASTDGTQDFLAEQYGDSSTIKPVLLSDNTGGSGGFYSGVLAAYADGHDWFWLMDDDVTAIPDGLEGLLRFADRSGCIHGRRVDFHGGAFFWQPRINERLGIPLPYLRDPFADGAEVFETNSGVFEGMLVSRDVVSKIGPPDPRFFITWDDAVYALVASRVTTVVYVDHFSLKRQREQRQASLAVRHLNDASDLFRFHVMRNRGYMAHYLRYLGAYNAPGFALGTLLTFLKEMLRLVYVEHSLHGTRALLRGWRESRRLLRQPWQPIGTSALDAPRSAP
jgi:rhamnopyranosyl-N-acetylglucosaminyl-diphospho-decaprenol beta-1,3/1,4-galactofuranosyltransferase